MLVIKCVNTPFFLNLKSLFFHLFELCLLLVDSEHFDLHSGCDSCLLIETLVFKVCFINAKCSTKYLAKISLEGSMVIMATWFLVLSVSFWILPQYHTRNCSCGA